MAFHQTPFHCINCNKDFATQTEIYHHVCDNSETKKLAQEMGRKLGVAVAVSQ